MSVFGRVGNCLTFFKQPQRYILAKASATQESDGKILKIPEPQLDIDRYCDPNLTEYFANNVSKRKGIGSISRVIELYNKLAEKPDEMIRRELIQEALKIPNETHAQPAAYGNDPKVIKLMGSTPKYSFQPKPFDQLMEYTDQFRMKELTPFAGHKAYYLCRELAELEHALIKYVVQRLSKKGFAFISVPDILHHQIIECCGVATKGKRNIVYRLDADKHLASAAEGELCLSGTAEMALGGFLMNKKIRREELPKRYVAVSRCYRAETADVAAERGLYRVHQFTKVEMFGASTSCQSEVLLEEFRAIQEEIFNSFNLHLQVLDMPPHELGAPAHRKYDIEAWLPSRNVFGEVSSCSNCTDYQARRLNIQCVTDDPAQNEFVHTVNGTACAIPRLIMAICETHQQKDGTVKLPEVLQPYMSHKDVIKPSRSVSKFVRRSKEFSRLINLEKN
ncbi:serine--tRNA ligase, mitochondrial [Thrips palmi]|uniref:serine--tRNA ligase n=1 Tax=Thrips palmi TaxID=161013 RepID=A0A6P8Y664_THRPL|nr:serine--tRNA ligase, mitochondrial [Thrips palmi]XP_034235103.1 serine--tRNA ligase, mitochondrial [Thrips palmi]